jgi:hypothetical protein
MIDVLLPLCTYTVVEWSFPAQGAGPFEVTFVVTHSTSKQQDYYTIDVPFQGEDPAAFALKLQNYMVSHVAYLENLHKVKSLLGGYTFSHVVSE